MKRSINYFILISTVSILIFASWSCSDIVPEVYKQGAIKLKNELENLEKIPLEEREIQSNKKQGSHLGIINFRKRAEYIIKNKRVWNDIFTSFDDAIKSEKLGQWQDDLLFCRALGQLEVTSLDSSVVTVDSAISAMNDFIEFKQNSTIEPWTKKQLQTVFWDKIAGLFSNKISEKRNINAYFHIGIASLMEHKKGDATRALEEYEKVLEIDPNGFLAQQAYGQIQLLKERSGESPGRP